MLRFDPIRHFGAGLYSAASALNSMNNITRPPSHQSYQEFDEVYAKRVLLASLVIVGMGFSVFSALVDGRPGFYQRDFGLALFTGSL